MDSNLNYAKISKGIGILFKLRDFVLIDNLIQVYHSVIYPFLIYDALVWVQYCPKIT
jgi:hypothetical protein